MASGSASSIGTPSFGKRSRSQAEMAEREL
jgi:ribosomal protein L37E